MKLSHRTNMVVTTPGIHWKMNLLAADHLNAPMLAARRWWKIYFYLSWLCCTAAQYVPTRNVHFYGCVSGNLTGSAAVSENIFHTRLYDFSKNLKLNCSTAAAAAAAAAAAWAASTQTLTSASAAHTHPSLLSHTRQLTLQATRPLRKLQRRAHTTESASPKSVTQAVIEALSHSVAEITVLRKRFIFF